MYTIEGIRDIAVPGELELQPGRFDLGELNTQEVAVFSNGRDHIVLTSTPLGLGIRSEGRYPIYVEALGAKKLQSIRALECQTLGLANPAMLTPGIDITIHPSEESGKTEALRIKYIQPDSQI